MPKRTIRFAVVTNDKGEWSVAGQQDYDACEVDTKVTLLEQFARDLEGPIPRRIACETYELDVEFPGGA